MAADPTAPEFETLYHRAFADYGLRALWNIRELEHPSAEEALSITRNLRVEGDLRARGLAEQIERACRAGHPCETGYRTAAIDGFAQK